MVNLEIHLQEIVNICETVCAYAQCSTDSCKVEVLGVPVAKTLHETVLVSRLDSYTRFCFLFDATTNESIRKMLNKFTHGFNYRIFCLQKHKIQCMRFWQSYPDAHIRRERTYTWKDLQARPGGGGGGTLIFSYIRRLGSFFFFWGGGGSTF